jgi:hypothetical protein
MQSLPTSLNARGYGTTDNERLRHALRVPSKELVQTLDVVLKQVKAPLSLEPATVTHSSHSRLQPHKQPDKPTHSYHQRRPEQTLADSEAEHEEHG